MHYEGMVIRPPSEANSILLQVTVGCSHNKCTFCGTYKNERFRIKSDEIILADIQFAAQFCKNQNRLFLCDGDALIIPQKRLVKILSAIRDQLPWVERIGVYANAKSIRMKTIDELNELKSLGLKIAYMGLESGDDVTLKNIRKGATSQTMIEMGKKLKSTGIKLSVTVLLGIAGEERSMQHAQKTGDVLSQIDPDFVGALSLMLIPDTPLHSDYAQGTFPLLSSVQMLAELGVMISNTNLSHGLFHANHASNYLPIRALLPMDKAKTLTLIQDALDGKINLKPEYLRAL